MSKTDSEQWDCPECCQKGEKSNVRLLQMNSTHAIYMCENKKCLFPGSAVKKLPLLKRSPEEMSIPPEELEAFGLPCSLQDEEGLNISHMNKLLEFNAIVPYIERMLEAEEKWKAFIENMNSLGISLKNASSVNSYNDPDLEKFKNISTHMRRYLTHLVPNDLYNSLLNRK